ncbi:hypothetical protein [Kitasatospora sp. NPDC092286]|uniref:hypothetical protein n=1 Tax=Kitasatospora sp. NPDC092286 TaxID=3364087 RepID=UPI0038075A39
MGALALVLAVFPVWHAPQAVPGVRPGKIVQIVAHQDDDLLFMNPDVSSSIRRGFPVVTVFITAGDANRGPAYARDRQRGVRRAYAQMAGVRGCGDDGSGCWMREVYRPVEGGPAVERDTLRSATYTRVVFLNLPEWTDRDAAYLGGEALDRLWRDPALSSSTLDMDGAGGVWPQRYDRAALIGVLNGLLAAEEATLVRVQDPAPDPSLAADHGDHIRAAWFGQAAVDRYSATGRRRVVVEHYRDYNTRNSPANLASAESAGKHATFEGAYAPTDDELADELTPGVCADQKRYRCWQSRQYPRSPRSTQVVTADRDGALHAFVVESGRLYEWYEDADKAWRGPNMLGTPGGPLVAGLSVGRDQDGRPAVFGQRADTGEIVSCRQDGTGGWTWQPLGSPNEIAQAAGPLGNAALQVSTPVVASNGDGRLQLFVRNRDGGLSTRWQREGDGAWSGWADLGQHDLQGPPTAVTTRDGRIEVFALSVTGGRSTVRHWYQPAPGALPVIDPGFPVIAPTSTVSAAVGPDGRLELYYRSIDAADPLDQYASSSTAVLTEAAEGGAWGPQGRALNGTADDGGSGEAAIATPGPVVGRRTVVAVRNRDGAVSVSTRDDSGSFGAWTHLGGYIVGVPAAGIDRDGLTDLVTIGIDGRLYDNRQKADGSFAGWLPMGDS